jgi:hypothetical protein
LGYARCTEKIHMELGNTQPSQVSVTKGQKQQSSKRRMQHDAVGIKTASWETDKDGQITNTQIKLHHMAPRYVLLI